MDIPPILDNPVVMGVVLVAVIILFQYQRTLSWPEYRFVHGLKRRYAPVVDRHTNLFVLSRKGGREDAEYLRTVEGPVRRVWRVLVEAGGTPHLINSVKRRPYPHGETQLSAAHVVWTHDDGTQTEAYLFDNGDGTVDVYAHHEATVFDPADHLDSFQTDGDVKGVVRAALAGDD